MRARSLLTLLVATVAVAPAGAAGPDWSRVKSMPHPRSAHAVVVAGGSIYVLGGPSTAVVDRFDGTRWHRETTLPGGILNAPTAVALGRKLYVVGGFSASSNLPVSSVRVYDVVTHKWSAAARLPAPRGGHAAVVLGGKIHVIGGGNSTSTIAAHSVYDPAANRWSSAAPLPRAEGSPAAVALGGKLYAIGGRSGLDDYGEVYVYDAGADRWSRGPSIPPRGTAGAAVFNGAIYLFGGESQARARTLGEVFRLAPADADWTQVATMPQARNYARAVVFRKALYVVGGSATAGNSHGAVGSTRVDRFTP
jgi:N-acetylneuraminic acid mutarotase